MLHSRLMEYVDQVARLGSIRAAGARLHVAPSAINRQILLLEEELGEPLFERLPRGMRPTQAGEILVAHIRSTMQQYRETIAEMQSLRALPSGEITVATVSGLASSILPATAARFHDRSPTILSGNSTLDRSAAATAKISGESHGAATCGVLVSLLTNGSSDFRVSSYG